MNPPSRATPSPGDDPTSLRWPRLGEALTLRCPVCWSAPMFASPLKMHARCPGCGHTYDQGHGYFLGAMYFSYTVVVLLEAVLVTGLRLAGVGWATTLAVAVASVLLVGPLLAFPVSRWLWVTIERRFLRENNDDALRAEVERRRAARDEATASEVP